MQRSTPVLAWAIELPVQKEREFMILFVMSQCSHTGGPY